MWLWKAPAPEADQADPAAAPEPSGKRGTSVEDGWYEVLRRLRRQNATED